MRGATMTKAARRSHDRAGDSAGGFRRDSREGSDWGKGEAMNPWLKFLLAGLGEVAVIFVLLNAGTRSRGLNSHQSFTETDAIFWVFISIFAFGFVIYFIKRSIR